MNHCNKCGEAKPTHKAVIDGVYYRHICDDCAGAGASIPLDGKYQRDRQREDFAKEILQPLDRNGEINADFAQAYQPEAEKMFGEERLKGKA